MEAEVSPSDVGTDILTLRLDDRAQAHFEALRQRYFPPERNLIPAHLTLFHALPRTAEIADQLALRAGARRRFPLRVTGLRSLGRGVAYTLTAGELSALHRELASDFAEHLSAQDRQKFQPHIVVQNKATAEQARTLLALLQASFQPLESEAIGLDLWHYRGGPWELSRFFAFD